MSQIIYFFPSSSQRLIQTVRRIREKRLKEGKISKFKKYPSQLNNTIKSQVK